MKKTTANRPVSPTAKELRRRGFRLLKETKYPVPGPRGSVLLPAGEKNVWVKYGASSITHTHDGDPKRCNVYYKRGRWYYGV